MADITAAEHVTRWPHINRPLSWKPVDLDTSHPFSNQPHTHSPLLTSPLAPLLFTNGSSDARDHLANERTFLAWLRLSVYMSVVALGILVSFHLKNEPTPLERRLALPLGLVFWALSLACLASGVANYWGAVAKMARRRAMVQTGWKTQVVFTIVATAIVGSCGLFLGTNVQQPN